MVMATHLRMKSWKSVKLYVDSLTKNIFSQLYGEFINSDIIVSSFTF